MSKQQLRVKCLKKRDKLFEQNHHFHFSIVTCLLMRTDVCLICAKQKRTWEVWSTGSHTNIITNSQLLTANPLPQTVPNQTTWRFWVQQAGFAVPKPRWHNFLLMLANTVIPPCTSTAHEYQACATGILDVFQPLRFKTELILLTEKRHHQSSVWQAL